MTVRADIRDATIAELNASLPTGIPLATKRRYMPGSKTADPRIAVFFADESTEPVGGRAGALIRRTLVLAIQGIVAVEDPASADDAMEPLLEHITAVLGNTTLGGLALSVDELSTQWGSDDSAGLFIHMAVTRWRVEYQTLRGDLNRRQ